MNDILQISEFHINRINIDLHHGKEKALDYSTLIDFAVACNTQDNRHYRLTMGIKFNPKEDDKTGYIINSEIVGYFFCPDGIPESDRDLFVRYNGSFILYGILRGEIANFTGSFPEGRFILPTVNMNAIVTETIKKAINNSTGKSTTHSSPKKALKTKPIKILKKLKKA